ncbi:T9SS type A sorting domain-containing protein [Fulvivirga sp. 29W222]|uniref:T9SS type A sorting domain-containing protein n=1 Tax=Fulvivirga marina TaxID=2494733 RepID=A0A937G3D7_9BACT|nr:T9SS type A sorting domain-containing protein [Fulvivirga marina]MBL6447701.1 T9SS type A sorting domain-containing protein [Fulvivirga marina]
MKRILYLSFLAFFIISQNVFSQDLCKPVGWATQNGSVTGGGNATPVVVDNYNDLKSAIRSSSVKVVHISGTIEIPSGGLIYFQDQSDKTLFGLPGSKLVSNDMTKSNSGILIVKRCKNIILRNITFEGPGAYDINGYDNLMISTCTNVWVDHCEFYDGLDGNFDINKEADLISITWCKFGYNKAPKSGGPGGDTDDHRFSNLIGSSNSATGNRGKLRITFQNCWWAPGCKARMPRVRFGKVHLVNNYFNSTSSTYCIRAAYEANLLVEGNVFENVTNPIDLMKDYTAVTVRDNLFTGSTSGSKSGNGSAFRPPYDLDVKDPATIVDPITSCAGATLPGPGECSSCSTTEGSSSSTGLAASLVKHGTGSPSQSINLGESIVDFNFEWANASTVEVAGMPAGINVDVDNANQTVSFSGTPSASGSFDYTITTVGGKPDAVKSANITVNKPVETNQSPISLQASGDDGAINLSWTLNGITPDVIQVMRDTDPNRSGRVRIAFVTSGSTYRDENVSNGTTYYYWIKVTDTSGNLTESGSASATPNGGNSGVPASLAKHGSGSSSQTINLGESIVGFYYNWLDANTVNVTGLPAGIKVAIDNSAQTVSFSGAPTESGSFDYTVTTVGGNPEAVKVATFTVNAANTSINPDVDQTLLVGVEGNSSEEQAVNNSNEVLKASTMPELENLSVKVFPNPVKETLTIEGEFNGNWMLFDMQNRKVMEGNQSSVQMEGMKQGIYILKVEEKVIRIIKRN